MQMIIHLFKSQNMDAKGSFIKYCNALITSLSSCSSHYTNIINVCDLIEQVNKYQILTQILKQINNSILQTWSKYCTRFYLNFIPFCEWMWDHNMSLQCALESKGNFLLQTTRTSRSRMSAGRSQSRTTQNEQATQHRRLLPRRLSVPIMDQCVMWYSMTHFTLKLHCLSKELSIGL